MMKPEANDWIQRRELSLLSRSLGMDSETEGLGEISSKRRPQMADYGWLCRPDRRCASFPQSPPS